jgi:hypothetical protein
MIQITSMPTATKKWLRTQMMVVGAVTLKMITKTLNRMMTTRAGKYVVELIVSLMR